MIQFSEIQVSENAPSAFSLNFSSKYYQKVIRSYFAVVSPRSDGRLRVLYCVSLVKFSNLIYLKKNHTSSQRSHNILIQPYIQILFHKLNKTKLHKN